MKTDPNNRIEIRRIETGKQDVGNCYPLTAAITITCNCGECLLVERSCGNKLSCKHPRAMQLRPYVDTLDHKNERKVTEEGRPDWCPL